MGRSSPNATPPTFWRGDAPRFSGGLAHEQRLEVAAPPRVGGLDLVERVEVDPADVRDRVAEQRGQLVEETVGPVVATGPEEAPHEAEVLHEEAAGVADPDLAADRDEAMRLDGPGHTDLDRQQQALCTTGGDPRPYGAGSKQSWVVM